MHTGGGGTPRLGPAAARKGKGRQICGGSGGGVWIPTRTAPSSLSIGPSQAATGRPQPERAGPLAGRTPLSLMQNCNKALKTFSIYALAYFSSVYLYLRP